MSYPNYVHRLLLWLAEQKAYMIERDRDLGVVIFHSGGRWERKAGPGDSLLDLLDQAYEEIHMAPIRARELEDSVKYAREELK